MWRVYYYLRVPGILPYGLALVRLTSEPLESYESAARLHGILINQEGATGGGVEKIENASEVQGR